MTTETQTTKPTTAKPRRWLRFRLRTLLILVTVLSVSLGWVGWELDQRRRENAVVAWVEEMGGEVYFFSEDKRDQRSWLEKKKGKWLGERVRTVALTGKDLSHLSLLAELKKLEFLNLYDTQGSDLSPLAELKNVKALVLSNTKVSDLSPLAELENLKALFLIDSPVSDLSPLAKLKKLKHLDFRSIQVSDLSPLSELNNLETLWLIETQVSDLSPLSELKNLETLGLSATKVNDLSPLAKLKNLGLLRLDGTQVSEEQVEELKLALPNCNIELNKQR